MTRAQVAPRASETIEVVTNAPAVRMEDITPAGVSAADRLAPHEVHAKAKVRCWPLCFIALQECTYLACGWRGIGRANGIDGA